MIEPTNQLKSVFDTLKKPLIQFQTFLAQESARLDHLKDVRVDDEVTQLFVDTDRAEIVTDLAFASIAIANLKALIKLAERQLA